MRRSTSLVHDKGDTEIEDTSRRPKENTKERRRVATVFVHSRKLGMNERRRCSSVPSRSLSLSQVGMGLGGLLARTYVDDCPSALWDYALGFFFFLIFLSLSLFLWRGGLESSSTPAGLFRRLFTRGTGDGACACVVYKLLPAFKESFIGRRLYTAKVEPCEEYCYAETGMV